MLLPVNFVKISSMQIIMLVGPPGSGKTTFVATNRQPGDCQVDIDLIPRDRTQHQRLLTRHALLQRAAKADSPHTCWFSTAAPERSKRDYWRSCYPISRTIIFALPLAVVYARQQARDGIGSSLGQGVHYWYERYEPPTADEINTEVRIE